MFGKPLLAHPSERDGVHTTSSPHSGDDDDRDRHDDEADDQQHRVLAVTNVLSRRMVMFAFLQSPVCALMHRPRLREGCRVPRHPAAISVCGGPVGTPRPMCAFGDSAVQPRRVLFWYATHIAQGRPGHRLGFGGVDRWPRREPELTFELGCPSWLRHLPADLHDVGVERSSPNDVREHSRGTPMTDLAAIVADLESELRWRNWQARGAEGDRRTAKRMRALMILIAAAFLVWFVVQLA